MPSRLFPIAPFGVAKASTSGQGFEAFFPPPFYISHHLQLHLNSYRRDKKRGDIVRWKGQPSMSSIRRNQFIYRGYHSIKSTDLTRTHNTSCSLPLQPVKPYAFASDSSSSSLSPATRLTPPSPSSKPANSSSSLSASSTSALSSSASSSAFLFLPVRPNFSSRP